MAEFLIRQATLADAEQILTIYRPYVEDTAISFESKAPTISQMASRIDSALTSHEWLVAVTKDQRIAGYAYGSPHRPREAYQKSVEVSAYVHPDFHRRGLARQLYQQLFAILKVKGFNQGFAGITLPNDASVAMHRSVGFEAIGVFREVGHKFDRWHDVSWWQRSLQI